MFGKNHVGIYGENYVGSFVPIFRIQLLRPGPQTLFNKTTKTCVYSAKTNVFCVEEIVFTVERWARDRTQIVVCFLAIRILRVDWPNLRQNLSHEFALFLQQNKQFVAHFISFRNGKESKKMFLYFQNAGCELGWTGFLLAGARSWRQRLHILKLENINNTNMISTQNFDHGVEMFLKIPL